MSGNGYKYIGTFSSYEQCTESPNITVITAAAKAITFNGLNMGGGWQGQCFSIDDTNTNVNQNCATCGIRQNL